MVVGAVNGLALGSVEGRRLGFQRPFVPTFPPYNPAGLVAWLDGADSLRLDQGFRVASWFDKWNGGSAVQSNPTFRPYVNSVNSKPCAYFPDGANCYLDASYLAQLAFQNGDPWMLTFVWNVGRQDIIQFPFSLLGYGGIFAGMVGAALYGERTSSTGGPSVASNQGTGPMVASLRFDGSRILLRKNGVDVGQAPSTGITLPTIAWVGGDPRDGGTRFVFANVCEIVVHDLCDVSVLSSVESYLSAKWNAVY